MNKSTSSETKSKKTDKEEHGVLQEYAKFYNKKENLVKFSNNNLKLKRLKSIEKKHMKNIKLDKIVKI